MAILGLTVLMISPKACSGVWTYVPTPMAVSGACL
jgi:hypothetical protein